MSKADFAVGKIKAIGDRIVGLGNNLGGTVCAANNVITRVGRGETAVMNTGGVFTGLSRGVGTLFAGDTQMIANGKNLEMLQKLTGDAEMTAGKTVKLDAIDRFKMMHMNSNGSYSGTKIAGTIAGGYMGVSAAGRIATGGGLYRDSSGNFNVIGVPLI